MKHLVHSLIRFECLYSVTVVLKVSLSMETKAAWHLRVPLPCCYYH